MIQHTPTPAPSKLSDIDAERWLLQCMILLPEANDVALAALIEEDFYDERHRIVWRHQKRLHEAGKPLDSLLLVASMKDAVQHGQSDFDRAGGISYVGELISEAVIPYHAQHYAERIRRASLLRRLHGVGHTIMSEVSLFDPHDADVDVLVSQCEQSLFEVTDASIGKAQAIKPFKDVIYETLDRIDKRKGSKGDKSGLMTGIEQLDNIIGGFRPGELVVIGARPSCGKSALAMNFAEHMTTEGNARVIIASLEMSAPELAERMLGSASRINLYSLRNGTTTKEDSARLVETAAKLGRARLYVDDAPSRTVSQLGSFCRMYKRRHKGLDCLIIDYIQLVTPENGRDPRQEQVAKISRRLKTLARELQIPVLCLAQLNRQADDPGKPPRLSQLRESGAIEQDADVVIFIHRPEASKPDSDVNDCEQAEIHVAKQRNGPTGIVKVNWFRRWCRFESIADKWMERRDTTFDDWNTP